MSAAKLSADALFQMAKARRTVYALNKHLPIPASRVRELVNESTLHTPSAFNSQSNRTLVLLGAEHDKLWDMAAASLKAIVPAEQWDATAGRMAGFKAGAGTVLFFDDEAPIRDMQANFATYADRFPGWASQSNGMQQYLLWTALALEGVGASLQHYSPIIDAQVASTWGIPATWKLNAQLVFGGKAAEAADKEYKPVDERVKVFGA